MHHTLVALELGKKFELIVSQSGFRQQVINNISGGVMTIQYCPHALSEMATTGTLMDRGIECWAMRALRCTSRRERKVILLVPLVYTCNADLTIL